MVSEAGPVLPSELSVHRVRNSIPGWYSQECRTPSACLQLPIVEAKFPGEHLLPRGMWVWRRGGVGEDLPSLMHWCDLGSTMGYGADGALTVLF